MSGRMFNLQDGSEPDGAVPCLSRMDIGALRVVFTSQYDAAIQLVIRRIAVRRGGRRGATSDAAGQGLGTTRRRG